METWFWAAVIATGLMGIGNFTFKLAAKRGYDGATFSLYGAITTLPPIFALAFIVTTMSGWAWIALLAGAVSGFMGATNNVSKVIALRYIDTTIYFPLFKLLSPLLAIIFGWVFFVERFSSYEWIGLALGLLVPLLLINPKEKGRQTDLVRGLLLVVFTAVLAAAGAALIKYATEVWPDIWWITAAQITGLLIGSITAILIQNRELVLQVLNPRNVDNTLIFWAFLRSLVMAAGVLLVNYAYVSGGSLAIVHTITSMYILIPIVLAIIFYNEHWNLQKVVAIVLSVASLALLG